MAKKAVCLHSFAKFVIAWGGGKIKEETNQSRTARRNFGRLGWALLVVLGVLSAVTFLLMLCIAVAAMDPSRGIRFLLVYDFPYWVLCRLPLYALGAVLAYVYLRSGGVRYCMLIHSLSNFCAAGMMQLFLNRLSPKAFMAMQMEDLGMFTPDVLLELLPLAVYTLIYYILVVVGLVLLIRNRKKAVFEPAEQPLTKNQAVHALFGSAGMTLFIGVSLLMLLNSLSAPFVQ